MVAWPCCQILLQSSREDPYRYPHGHSPPNPWLGPEIPGEGPPILSTLIPFPQPTQQTPIHASKPNCQNNSPAKPPQAIYRKLKARQVSLPTQGHIDSYSEPALTPHLSREHEKARKNSKWCLVRQERLQGHVTQSRGLASTLGVMENDGEFQAGEVRAQGERRLAWPWVMAACPHCHLQCQAPIHKVHDFPITLTLPGQTQS